MASSRPTPPTDWTSRLKRSIPVDGAAGFCAGTVATLVVHPLDLLKTRLQLDQAGPKASRSGRRIGRSLRMLRDIATLEHRAGVSLSSSSPRLSPSGSVRALYRGLGPNLVGNSVSWALYFYCYQALKDRFSIHSNSPSSDPSAPISRSSSSSYFAASSLAGIFTILCTNPIWVVKTRMLASAASSPGAYPSMTAGFRQIIKADGPIGLYRGLVPSLFGVIHGAVQFVVYEQSKSWAARQQQDPPPAGFGTSPTISTVHVLGSSIFSKTVATAITYPYQVVRARLQTYSHQPASPDLAAGSTARYGTVVGTTRSILAFEGVGGFYKGLGANLVRVLPATCVTLVVYEKMKAVLVNEREKDQLK